MSEIDYLPDRVHAVELESQLSTKLSKTELLESELTLLRTELDAVNTIRKNLQVKLDAAVEYANNQAKQIQQLKAKPSEINELKVFLGKVTERNNFLNFELQKRNEEIDALRGTPSVIDELKSQIRTTTEFNSSLLTKLDTANAKLVPLENDITQRNQEISALQQALQQQVDTDHNHIEALEAKIHNQKNQISE